MPGRAENHWQRVVVNYTRQQYHSGNQNWQAAQSKEGWMYFANNKGLLEYDGNTWQTYPLPGNAKVRAVRTSGDTIYVGALGQFGFFTRNPKGQFVYHRLSESVERAGQLNIWNIHQIGHDIYYQSDNPLYINNSETKINSPLGISYSTVVYNRLYAVGSRGVFVLVGNEARRMEKTVPADQFKGICVLSPYPRTMGTDVPSYASKATFELPQISFTNDFIDSCTTVALQTAIELTPNRIFIVGYDGYRGQVLSDKEMELSNENRQLFNQFEDFTSKSLVSLTPSLYRSLHVKSIYQFL
jgi:hypothetical protein